MEEGAKHTEHMLWLDYCHLNIKHKESFISQSFQCNYWRLTGAQMLMHYNLTVQKKSVLQDQYR